VRRTLSVLLFLFATASLPTPAADIRTLEVNDQEGHYSVRYDVLLDVPRDTVYNAIANPDRWPRLTDAVTSAEILGKLPNGRRKVSVTFRECVLFFCQSVNKHEALMTSADGNIETLAIPEQSDFSYAHEHWRISTENRRTRIEYQADMTPSFYLPPVVGAYIFKAKIRALLHQITDNLETLSTP